MNISEPDSTFARINGCSVRPLLFAYGLCAKLPCRESSPKLLCRRCRCTMKPLAGVLVLLLAAHSGRISVDFARSRSLEASGLKRGADAMGSRPFHFEAFARYMHFPFSWRWPASPTPALTDSPPDRCPRLCTGFASIVTPAIGRMKWPQLSPWGGPERSGLLRAALETRRKNESSPAMARDHSRFTAGALSFVPKLRQTSTGESFTCPRRVSWIFSL